MNICVVLSFILFFSVDCQAASGVDIFMNGIHYPSIEAYRSAKDDSQKGKDSLSIEDEQYLSLKSKELGVAYDPNKLKTINLTHVSQGKAIEKLKSVSMEGMVSKVMVDFHQNWDNPMPKFTIFSNELQNRLESLVAGRKNPVLLVAGDHKLRVMELKEESK